MFRFLTPKPKDGSDPLDTPRAASAWFRHLPVRDVIGRQQHVVKALEPVEKLGKSIGLERIAAIEWIDDALIADRQQLVRQYVDNASSSEQIADRVWQAAFDLSQAFIRAYKASLATALASAVSPQWKRELPRLFARLVRYYGVDAKLRILRGEQWIPAKWPELHRLYLQAADHGVARIRVPPAAADPAGEPRSVEEEYLTVLLLHLLNNGTFAPAEIDWAGTRLRAWTSRLVLEPGPDTARDGFCVDLASKAGLARCTGNNSDALQRYLDAERIVEQLEHDIATLQGPEASDADALRLSRQQQVNILEKMRPVMTEGAHASPNRQPRMVLNLAADVRVGLAQICQQLSGRSETEDAFEPGAAASPPAGGTEQPAGESAPAAGRDLDRRMQPRPARPESLWLLEDRSESGLRLSGKGEAAQTLALGALVAVRELRNGAWQLGVVRRVNRTPAASDIGVSIIANDVRRITLHTRRHAREDMGFVVDGIDVSTIGMRFHGLYLPPPSRPENPVSSRTLIIPTSEYAHGRRVVLITDHSVVTVALNKSLEQRPDWTWAAVEVVNKTPRG